MKKIQICILVIIFLSAHSVYAGNLLYKTGFETESSISEVFYTSHTEEPPTNYVAITKSNPHSGSKSIRGNVDGGCAAPRYHDPITGLDTDNDPYLNIGTKGYGDWGTSHPITTKTGKKYISYWIKFDVGANFEKSNNYFPDGGICTTHREPSGQYKMLYLSNRDGMEFIYLNQGIKWTNLYDGGNSLLHEGTDSFGVGAVNDGSWHHYELFMQMESPHGTGGNGILQVWRDGVLKYTKKNMNFSCSSLNTDGCAATGGTQYTSIRFIQYTFCPCDSSGWQIDDIEIWDDMPSESSSYDVPPSSVSPSPPKKLSIE